MPDSGGGAGGGGGAVLYFQGSLKTNTSVLEERGNWDQQGWADPRLRGTPEE